MWALMFKYVKLRWSKDLCICEIKEHIKKRATTCPTIVHGIKYSFPRVQIFEARAKVSKSTIFKNHIRIAPFSKISVISISSSVSVPFYYVREKRATDLKKPELFFLCDHGLQYLDKCNTGGPWPDTYLLTWHQTGEFHYENSSRGIMCFTFCSK